MIKPFTEEKKKNKNKNRPVCIHSASGKILEQVLNQSYFQIHEGQHGVMEKLKMICQDPR